MPNFVTSWEELHCSVFFIRVIQEGIIVESRRWLNPDLFCRPCTPELSIHNPDTLTPKNRLHLCPTLEDALVGSGHAVFIGDVRAKAYKVFFIWFTDIHGKLTLAQVGIYAMGGIATKFGTTTGGNPCQPGRRNTSVSDA